MKVLKSLLDICKTVATVLLVVCILGIVALMLSELMVRNVINASFRWSTELNGFLFMWMSFMGLIILVNEEKLISLDMVYSRVPAMVQIILWALIRLALVFLGVIMVISYIDMYPILAKSKFSTMQWLKKNWQYLPSAIAGGYFVLQAVYELAAKVASGLKSVERSK